LLFARGETVFAAPFDEKRCVTTGAAVPVIEHVWISSPGAASLAVSQTGTLVYVSKSDVRGRLLRVDREGAEKPLTLLSRDYANPRVSPDGRSIVVEAESRLWLLDPGRGTMTRFTFGPGTQSYPVWTPDGRRVLFRSGPGLILSKATDGSTEETMKTEGSLLYPQAVSPDGETLVVVEISPVTSGDAVIFSLGPNEGKRQTLVGSPAYEGGVQFSPDGHYFVYASDESGRMEVYLQSYRGSGAKTQVSTDGGTQPRWSRDGGEIFYRNGPEMMSAPVSTADPLDVGKPSILFERDYAYGGNISGANYDVTPHGHFVVVKIEPPKLNFVLNWFEELKRKVPTH
jgi:eukaryotic-like serine/threonine-protein kinase